MKQRCLSVLMRKGRAKAGMTIEEMSERCGISVQTLFEMEEDYRLDPMLSIVHLVCAAYGFGIEEIEPLGSIVEVVEEMASKTKPPTRQFPH